MSLYEVVVPDLGSDEGADVIEILCAPGDSVKKEDIILVLESDKATMEIPSPVDGVVKEVLVSLGDKSFSDDKIVVLEQEEAGASSGIKEADKVVEPEPSVNSGSSDEKIEVDNKAQEPVLIEETVPDMGDDSAADLIEINVEIGQEIEADDILVVLESDKATMEIPASVSGKVTEIYAKLGDKLSNGDKIVQLLSTGAAPQVTAPSPKADTASAQQKAPQRERSVNANPLPSGAKVHAGPASRRLARELGVNLAEITGTGPKNRILKDDIKYFVKQRLSGQGSGGGLVVELPEIDFTKFGEVEEKALTRIKKVSAKNLTRSWLTIPHVTQFDEADITELEIYRKQNVGKLKEQGVKLTLLAFLVKASAYSLLEFPTFNASINNKMDSLILKKYVNIGVAVDTLEGLVVPVIKDANNKTIAEIASELISLSEKAREKKLMPADMQGGCFSISSLGGIGGTAFTPIVNWPEVAILGVSRSSMKPVYDGEKFEPKLILPTSLSYDHRVIDGAEAARFSRFICELLADTSRLSL